MVDYYKGYYNIILFLPEADLRDIQDNTWSDASGKQRFDMSREVTAEDIEARLKWTKPWTVPGPSDDLLTGFLKACSRPLTEALVTLTQGSFDLEYFPKCFQEAGVVVLHKPGKSAIQLQSTGG